METYEQSQKTQQSCQISTLPVQVCRVLHSVSQENEHQTPLIKSQSVVTSFITFAKSLELKNLAIFFLNKSREFYRVAGTKEKSLVKSSQGFQNWGMTANGKCLTLRISDSPKTEKGVSLSDILEESPDQKFFLSQERLTRLLASRSQQKPQLLEL